ncbi:MAG: acetyl ornithine aminotransferase family protein [Candidatus Melainabacteria bacterium]|nr:acetyl ornithine aminotransferase family protein [Candidatus Melainabacteria bacterium]
MTEHAMLHAHSPGQQTAAEDLPHLITSLPGPKTQALIARDQQFLSPSYTRGYPLSIEKGEGAMVIDADGNRFLDFCAGIAVCSTGHSHPEVVRVVQEQAARFLHMSGTDFYYTVMVDLAERLARLTPGSPDKRVFLCNSGAEANEGAIKLARYHTGRSHIVSFFRSFHGRTFGAMSVTASKAVQKRGFFPMLPGVVQAHYPYPYRDLFNSCCEYECARNCLKYLEEHVFKMLVPPEEVAAILVEPIQGEGGYIQASAEFLLGLQAMARKYGFLIIADEVQSGIGRTGKMWASQHVPGFVPDIITSAKGLASGLPLGAFIARAEVMSWVPGAHASTFGGNPVACAAAVKTLELVENGLMQHAASEGAYLKAELEKMAATSPVMGQVRGVGLMLGVEIVKDKTSKTKAPDLRNQIVDDCFEHGLLILGCGENSIRFSPPLVINRRQSQAALDIFARVLKQHTG